MRRVFGIPAGPLAVALLLLLAIAIGVLTVMAVRNFVFFKMGLRNIPRRRGRSALIVVGLMLGTTIIASSLFTGETMATTTRTGVVESLGMTDEKVIAGTDAKAAVDVGLLQARAYFPADAAVARIDAATAALPVDGVMAAIIESVAAQHPAAGRTEPRVTLFAPDPSRAHLFGMSDVATLAAGEVLLNKRAAAELRAVPGSDIVVLVGERQVHLRVARVGSYHGANTTESAVLLPLSVAQDLLGRPGQVNHVLVSNKGDELSGAGVSDQVEPVLDRAVVALGLDAQTAKQDGLDAADAAGNAFVSLFTTFGSFSMAAGILLIFLIFVMLSAERRPEMGMARAIGTQRRHLVQTFLFEGAAYDLVAAAVGAALGIGISYVMVRAVGAAFAGGGLDVSYSISLRSVVIAYALGVLLTLVVVTMSAWRVSRMNIVSAIRDIPEETAHRRPRSRWILAVALVVLGTLFAVQGASNLLYMPWMLGLSLIVLALVPIGKLLGLRERLIYSVVGAVLVAMWLLPVNIFNDLVGEMSMDFSIWVVSGLVIVVAATWLITYNADVFLGLAARLAAPFASLRPIARMAVAYPLRSRFRTGVTMSMFMLVVFTLVTGSTIPSAFTRAFNNVDKYGGNFDIQASTAPAAAVVDLRSELPRAVAADIVAEGAQSYVPVEARQDGTNRAFEGYPVRGVDAGFVERTTYGLSARATGYADERQVWDAVGATPGLAVVDSFVAPRRNNWSVNVPPAFHLSGFFIEDGTFDPIPVTVRDPMTGTSMKVTVIGVLADSAPFSMAGITVSQQLLAPLGERAIPTLHHLAVRSGADPAAVAASVEASLLPLGVEATTYASLLNDAVRASNLFLTLIQGFMGLGLVVGVAALGVVSARAVVERRQQIGMLRAIGFQPAMIRRGLLAETAIVAGTAIIVGTLLGLCLSYLVISDSSETPGYSDVTFAVPWLELALIFTAVMIAALLTSLVAAQRATRLYPAEALRYQ